MVEQHPAIQEVIDLHIFFEAWLGGALPETDAEFDRFTTATAPGFTLISPDGAEMDYTTVSTWIRRSYATRRGFRLWTTDHRLRYDDGGCALVTYLEWQERDGVTTCRISSALFVTNAASPTDYLWRHVHETWITPG